MNGDMREALELMRSTYGAEQTRDKSLSPDGFEAAPRETEHLTDLGNAERLVRAHGRDLRHAAGIGWFAWDGRRWRRDEDGEVMRRAKKTVRALYQRAGEIEDPYQRKQLLAWAQKSESAQRLQAAVTLAQTERPVIVDPRELDADPWLFNATNGTIDLRTGELREHSRGDLITRIAGAAYTPGARSDLWQQTLERVTGGDSELASFLQRSVGYSLTGHTNEDKLFFAHGPGATGKSTVLEAFKTALGEYATTANFETFLKRRNDNGPRNDIARLAGARLVISLEVDEGKALAEGLVKSMTGGDTVTARYLFRESFEFTPNFKLWLAANARPKVNADDDAMWRRILQVPFTNVIPEDERDERIKIRLKNDADVQAAILAWAVEGCLAWQQNGLQVPQTVRDYTNDYRAENDPLRDWLADCCELTADAFTASAELRRSYEDHTEAGGEKPVSSNAFSKSLKNKGCTNGKHNGVRGWRGIELR